MLYSYNWSSWCIPRRTWVQKRVCNRWVFAKLDAIWIMKWCHCHLAMCGQKEKWWTFWNFYKQNNSGSWLDTQIGGGNSSFIRSDKYFVNLSTSLYCLCYALLFMLSCTALVTVHICFSIQRWFLFCFILSRRTRQVALDYAKSFSVMTPTCYSMCIVNPIMIIDKENNTTTITWGQGCQLDWVIL